VTGSRLRKSAPDHDRAADELTALVILIFSHAAAPANTADGQFGGKVFICRMEDCRRCCDDKGRMDDTKTFAIYRRRMRQARMPDFVSKDTANTYAGLKAK